MQTLASKLNPRGVFAALSVVATAALISGATAAEKQTKKIQMETRTVKTAGDEDAGTLKRDTPPVLKKVEPLRPKVNGRSDKLDLNALKKLRDAKISAIRADLYRLEGNVDKRRLAEVADDGDAGRLKKDTVVEKKLGSDARPQYNGRTDKLDLASLAKRREAKIAAIRADNKLIEK